MKIRFRCKRLYPVAKRDVELRAGCVVVGLYIEDREDAARQQAEEPPADKAEIEQECFPFPAVHQFLLKPSPTRTQPCEARYGHTPG